MNKFLSDLRRLGTPREWAVEFWGCLFVAVCWVVALIIVFITKEGNL